ncbi:MAG: hypothetical protein WC992_05655 [Acholeplasmataceae bacterium]|nr:hypothetical protein [Acholeplasmataceae bacterium]
MSKMKYGYGWVLKFVLAAILVGVGVYMIFAKEVVYTITGVAIVVFSIFRVVPLLKSLNKEVLRTINLIEIIFDTLIGGILIYVALTRDLQNEAIWGYVYRYSLAFFFYARGLVYFNSVVFFGEKTEIPKFWVHIAALTLGTVIAVLPDFDHGSVAIFLLVISIIGAAYLGFDGYGGYKKYREYAKELNEGKSKEKEKQIEEEKRPILDKEEEKRPYVN